MSTLLPKSQRPRNLERSRGLFDPELSRQALKEAFRKLNPRLMAKNPVMFVVEVGTVVVLYLTVRSALTQPSQFAYGAAIFVLLLLTLLFANFAEALAEARGRAQAQSLRAARADLKALRLTEDGVEEVSSTVLRRGDRVRVGEGQFIPADGEVIEGLAIVDESAITGESAPVVREAGSDFNGITAGTRVLTGQIVLEVTSNPGESFLDRMIGLVEGAARQKTPNEIALTVLLAALTAIFLIVTITLLPFSLYAGQGISLTTLVALLVCLIPTTIGGLLSAIGIAGMDRALRANVIAKSGRAVEVAGDIDTLLLDKTGTITLGDRQATEFIPVQGVGRERLAWAALAASLHDTTPEGKSIVRLAREQGAQLEEASLAGSKGLEFTAQTRMSGTDLPGGIRLRKGASDRIAELARQAGNPVPPDLTLRVEEVARRGATPLVVAENERVLGVVALSDIVKSGIRERFAQLRRMGLRTVMITGDNPLTAQAIAKEAGVDDYIAEAKPEDKLRLIHEEQTKGHLVAMMGDGTNDAPALAQADVGLAMNSGTQAAKEAANMIDLDSDPTKLLEVVEIGKQLLITRGALTTFSVANDVAKFFAILPAIFVGAYPELQALNIMRLATPQSAILSAVIFNALIIPLLIPLALRGVSYRPIGADALLWRNLLIYGLGGVVVPFIGIKLIDLILVGISRL
ncbi:potassium-transporting ATPase subunit KdpB [Meiothermus granaticius]|uniref:Potassium-transporting ATPase ATP-binding subunit n=1 Tax=Meiothermus granaticius NBRC 107808 TaxID=1227551 RepID=A0A399F886_9DEIN|nr:potassium-transporting ATPase subunit KdpB [Meiothermus granaticius]RIH91479.1 Potassium-transporting ATPase ATP-binding subunit [Meiothermus granaticius NBRC 107808]GEM88284.1 potassium-transporting ATPase ATP-binding subunit [Meiothermus granaticius NBRC 107808]